MTYKVTRIPENIIVKKIFLYIVFVLFFPVTLSVQAQSSKNIEQKIMLLEKVYGTINGLVSAYEIHIGHMPVDFWQDRYLLGKFHAYIYFNLNHNMKEMKIPLTQEEMVNSEALLFNALTKDDAFSTMKQVVSLSNTGDKEFARGVKNAAKTLGAMVGKVDLRDPVIKKAKKLATSLRKLFKEIPKQYQSEFGAGEENLDLSTALTEILFYNYAKTKWKK